MGLLGKQVELRMSEQKEKILNRVNEKR